MIKHLIPEYRIDTDNLEEQIIHDYLNFSISPYFDELDEDYQKVFNSLNAKEYVFTEKMRIRVIGMFNCVKHIIEIRLQNMVDFPENIHNFLKENYHQQLNGLKEMNKIFTVCK